MIANTITLPVEILEQTRDAYLHAADVQHLPVASRELASDDDPEPMVAYVLGVGVETIRGWR